MTIQSTHSKKIIVLLLTLILLGVAFIFASPKLFNLDTFDRLNFFFLKGRKSEVLSSQEEKVSVFERASMPIYGIPKKLIIKSLGIDLPVVSVGVDEYGYLESPQDWNMAGWYQKGSRPAEVGNLLINAHYDDNRGRPAAFWKLKNIKLDDTVSVLDSYGRTYEYKVVKVYHVGIYDPERAKVFDPFEEGKSVMTLITCGGVWFSEDGTYSSRLVVNAELIQD